MGHQNNQVDVESLQESGRRRSGCLDVFLVMSVLILFVAVTALAVGGVMAVMQLQSKLREQLTPSINEPEMLKMTGGTPSTTYKMQNFAYLKAISDELKNSTMTWDVVHSGNGTSVGSNFIFNKEQHSLKPKQAGIYFMYVDLNLSCTYKCSAGLLTVRVGDKLTCQVELPVNSTSVMRKCWTVSKINGQTLLAQMTVPKAGLTYWKLETSSGFGMFLVD